MMNRVRSSVSVVLIAAELALVPVEAEDLLPDPQPLAPLIKPVQIILHAPPRVCYL
jgi:hypothetical protein